MATMRFKFKRGETLRLISHLDQQRLFQRAFRRAEIPMAYSSGFNPHPRLAFSGAMALGLTSDAEYGDIGLLEEMEPKSFIKGMNAVLPVGMVITEAWIIRPGTPSLSASLSSARYHITFYGVKHEKSDPIYHESITRFMDQETILIEKRNKKGRMQEADIRPFIQSLAYTGKKRDTLGFDLDVVYIDQKCVKPLLVMTALNDFADLELTVDATVGLHKSMQQLVDDDF
ncbi:TIGR03936 family radical SAM-associated protein [Eubacterium barkeri]|uniref:Radical SAM-linked protein n=1 Tax=Eubacterium barkeri TaxID=1528 RepID=A0A1H3IAU1_EUBBA|nr:TIGR03936 family radical SAM-associated protein [Eubacterium barkeri]SDY24545.1 radical SAM-linked protein [Eubacterium barkeri]